MFKKTEPRKHRFEPVLILEGKRHDLSNERKRKRDKSYNGERKLGRKVTKLKVDINKIFSYAAS